MLQMLAGKRLVLVKHFADRPAPLPPHLTGFLSGPPPFPGGDLGFFRGGGGEDPLFLQPERSLSFPFCGEVKELGPLPLADSLLDGGLLLRGPPFRGVVSGVAGFISVVEDGFSCLSLFFFTAPFGRGCSLLEGN